MDLKFLFGGVAQLVERLHGMQKVVGSIPIISTTFSPRSRSKASREFFSRERQHDENPLPEEKKAFPLFLRERLLKGNA